MSANALGGAREGIVFGRASLRRKFATAYMDTMRAAQLMEGVLAGTVDVAAFLDAGSGRNFNELHKLADRAAPTKGPMGPLKKRLSGILAERGLPTPALDSLADLIKQRNRLAHDYLLEEPNGPNELRAAIDELHVLRRQFSLMGFTLMRANIESLSFVGESFLAIKQAERDLWVRTREVFTRGILVGSDAPGTRENDRGPA